ncbi:ABC transporter permease [Breznakiella homolactica]|uniref:ABC transporter permease n=1 Tax=Breznakiella homolactica TaxID=2798577 RepID=A0A7T7XM74_9SPIR|nr:ABC transporter permease [Breznakiella homolactica]QQO08828.1 ABC transporter permease [Breznakiella homolactica]
MSDKSDAMGKKKDTSQWGLILARYKRNKLAIVGLVILSFIVIAIVSAPLYIDYEDVITQDIPNRFSTPSFSHIFGTDALGRDLLARIIYGGRISLFSGIVAVGVGLSIGLVAGGTAGYFGGVLDTIIMRLSDVLQACPNLLLSMAVCIALGDGTFTLAFAIAVTEIPRFTRLTRVSVLTLRSQEFVEAAKCCGTSNFRIIAKHILPNGIGPVIIAATFAIGGAILSIAALGFMGIGVSPPTPEWGTILSENRQFVRHFPHLGIIPGVMIGLTVACANFIGDGLRDALDPKMKR